MRLVYKEKPSGFTGKKEIKIISWWEKKFCCPKMQDMWGGERIGVDEGTWVVKIDEDVSLHFRDCYEDETEYIYESIKYCPFCGEIIEKEFPDTQKDS